MPQPDFVFLDPSGRRWTWARRIGVALILGVLLSLAAVVRTLLINAPIVDPESVRSLKAQFKSLDHIEPPTFSNRKLPPFFKNYLQSRAGLERMARLRGQAGTPRKSGKEIHLGYYDNADPYSYDSLVTHVGQLTHVVPEWFKLTDIGGRLDVEPDFKVLGVCAAHGLNVVPLLTNLGVDGWVPEPVEALARGPAPRRAAFIQELVLQLRAMRAPAVLVNFEQLDPTYKPEITALFREIQEALRPEGRELWIAVDLGDELNVLDLKTLSTFVGKFVATLYDENGEADPPGPIASQDWFEEWLGTLLANGTPEQWIIGMGNYGYVWEKGATKGEQLRFVDVMTLADHADAGKIESKGPLFNPSFGYKKNDKEHTVWFLDATTFYNQWMFARDHGVAGWALNRLGSEDPTLWQVVTDGEKIAGDAALRKKLEFLDGESFHANVGEGEFLQVDAEHSNGRREIKMNADGQMTASYVDTPDYATIYHQGEGAEHEVAITFDDGPDPVWTPKILDILKVRGVKAAFFLMGHNAERNPDLVLRILAEGHEIGNHTYTHPNLSLASPEQTRLELNATARLIEAITDRSTTLFRPPYNADSNPHDPREIEVIRQAQEMGYLTVGENIDPEDWERPGVEAIVNRVKRLRKEGSIILLHDAGGSREQTVKALPLILDYLQQRGDEVVSLSRLVGIPREQLMPSLEHVDSTPSRLVTEVGYRVWHYGSQLFFTLVLVATGLLFVRTLLVLGLALRNRSREKEAPLPSPLGSVSVVIAAYNEEKVIEQTLKALLTTNYPGTWEIVVVDDGSRDRTAELVEAIAQNEPRLRLIRQANGGKSHALREGIRQSKQEWIVFLDADTLFQPDTVSELVKPLAEERVAAVSGQARVGNARGWLTKFQSLEYICGFNLDRRAYHEWNCITVVPGAISVVRRHALEGIGGLSSDTLAEDTDMTLMLHRRGYRMAYAPRALAWTEAPETLSALIKQRFRWAFGTLQCLWKHRDLLFNSGTPALGWFSLPSVWIFQILLVALVPLVDVGLVLSFLGTVKIEMLVFVLGFLFVDITLVVVASLIDGAPLREVWRVIPMRFLYRPLLAWVVWKSLFQAIRGVWVGWGKLERTASVRVPL